MSRYKIVKGMTIAGFVTGVAVGSFLTVRKFPLVTEPRARGSGSLKSNVSAVAPLADRDV